MSSELIRCRALIVDWRLNVRNTVGIENSLQLITRFDFVHCGLNGIAEIATVLFPPHTYNPTRAHDANHRRLNKDRFDAEIMKKGFDIRANSQKRGNFLGLKLLNTNFWIGVMRNVFDQSSVLVSHQKIVGDGTQLHTNRSAS